MIYKAELIKALKEAYLLTDEVPNSHYHCSNCSCRGCNHATEDCTCTSDQLWEILKKLEPFE